MLGNTLDLRGHEQVCTRTEAEAYASWQGYSMIYFGNSEDPHDTVNDSHKIEEFKNNRLLNAEQLASLRGLMSCNNCDGSGLFYQMEDIHCTCVSEEG